MQNSITISFLLLLSFTLTLCNNAESSNTEPPTPRDTTITPFNAYSELFLDSLTLEQFISSEQLEDSMSSYLRNFYNSRNFNFAWFDEHGLTVQAQGFWTAHDRVIRQYSDSSIFDEQLHQIIDTLLSDSAFTIDKEALTRTELRFTHHFFRYVHFAYSGKLDPKNVQWNIPRRRLKPVQLLDSFLNNDENDWRPLSRYYELLEQSLFEYKNIQRDGGWGIINFSRTVKPGTKDKMVGMIKRRLKLIGLYRSADTSDRYDDSLIVAINKMERSFGLNPDGIIDRTFIEYLNVPVEERISQILINLERMKWMPEMPSNYLLANIPEFRLHVVENGKEVLGMKVVVGKAANRTVIFSDELKYVVFSPYWNIPRSIVRNEIYPAMQRSSSYLRRKNMEVTGYSGGLPVVRQKPGSGNALGQVKFIFPNSYNIYFHDTPSKSLFGREQRAFSHGCIRVQQPFDLAVYLLRGQPEWTNEEIRKAMNRTSEKWVTLREPVPVFITYFTAWVDENGLLHFAEDIYGHDRRMSKHLFE